MSTRTALKKFFETGDVPTEAQFADLIDSLAHLTDDAISQAEAEAGVSTTVRMWSAQRVAQAIAALSGGGSGGLTTQAVQASNFTAQSGNFYPLNTSGGQINITPPSEPSVGDRFGISDARRYFDTNSAIVRFQSAGQRFCGDASSAANLVFNKQDQAVVFEFIGGLFEWVLLHGSVN